MTGIRTIHWPALGDRATFQNALAWRVATVWCFAGAVMAATLALDIAPTFVLVAVGTVLGVSGSVLSLFVARSRARSVEVGRSFADLVIVHRGYGILLNRRPVVGAYATRTQAVRAALAVGTWAIIVRAYGQFWVLAGHRADSITRPVALRSRAVADIVPSVMSGDQPISA